MKRVVILAGLVVAGTVLPQSTNAGVPVLCENCSSIVEQLWQEARQAEQLAAEVETKVTVLRQYANMIQNSIALPSSIWSEVQSDIYQIRALANAASLLSGNAGGIMTRLNTAGSYASQASSLPTNIGQQFAMWQTTLGNGNAAMARTIGVQAGQEQNNAALQAAIQRHSQTAAGQMQVMQAGVEMGAMTNAQLQQIQTTLAVAAQQQANRDGIAAERQAIADAYTVQFMSQPAPSLTGYPRYR